MTTDAADFGFEANVEQLLELMTHSVYSERDVFLRELISNAADACEKLRYEALSDAALAEHPPHAGDDVMRGRADGLVDDEQTVHGGCAVQVVVPAPAG
mgnify:CR=1 FL=1